MAQSGELDPVLAAMQMQFEAQAAFHATARQAMFENTSDSVDLQAQQQGAVATGLAGLLQQQARAQQQQQLLQLQQQPRHQQHAQMLPQRQQLQQQQQQEPPVPGGGGRHGALGQGSAASAAAAGPAPAGHLQHPAHMPMAGPLLDRQGESKEVAVRMQKMKEAKAQKELEAQQQAERLRCHLHKRPKDSCKFCRKWQDFVNKGKEDKAALREQLLSGAAAGACARASALEKESTSRRLLELANPKTFGLPPLLQSHIIESQHFKSLMSVDFFEQIVDEIWQFSDSVEPYMQNSSTVPSALFCCLYRLLTMGLDGRQLRRLIDSSESPFIRCVGFLFVRFALEPGQFWAWLGEYVLDDEEFKPTKDTEWVTTVGEYVEGLLSQDRYYSIIFPRVPMSTKRQLEAKLAQVPQYRKRTQANQRLLDVYRQRDVRIEACPDDSMWVSGFVIQLDESASTRLKVRVRLDGGREALVHIGKIILSDHRFSTANGFHRALATTHRQRSRSRSPQVDWARQKGKSQAELISEQRSRDRERAVCASGKEYARKPVGFKVACALPREMGAASHRLMEDETFVPIRRESRRRSPSPVQQDARKVHHSAEHQAQMQQLFEKYGMAKGLEISSQPQNNLVEGEGPDVMRLG
mmetsp:Transcript_88441/g.286397  ORF Transcript_88441/g.286397 Transcript_88441/m.286397 type:complete len:639 (-) Transcript_88441:62-1978(-)